MGYEHVGRAGEGLIVTPASSSLTRRVFSGSAQISLASALARAISLFTIPLLTRWLGPTAYGVLSLAATIVGLASTLALLGLDLAYARFFLEADHEAQPQVEAFCWGMVLLSSIVMTLMVSLGWYVLAEQWDFASRHAVSLFLIPAIVLTNLATLATTRARLAGAYKRLAFAILISAALAALFCLGVAAAGVRGPVPLLLSALIASLATVMFLGMPSLSSLWFYGHQLSGPRRWQLLRLGFSSAVSAPLYWLMASSDRWFLAGFSSAGELGIYSLASTLASTGLILNTAVTLTLFPEASRLYVHHSADERAQLARLFERLALALALVWVAIATLGPPALHLLTAPSFHSGSVFIPWLAAGVFFYGLAGLGNLPFFLIGKMEAVVFFWLLGAAATLGGDALLVPKLGGLGAAMAQAIAFALLALLTLSLGRRVLVMPIRWLLLGTAAVTALIWILIADAWMISAVWADLVVKSLGWVVFSTLFVALFLPETFRLYGTRLLTGFGHVWRHGSFKRF